MNRLAAETSPYLLQHQHNPVDWYAWGPEAFEAARRDNKPIFLSVGYSTCYWCHVMERQSFENEQVAAEMNQRFINIKVDREERPDVDQLYMTAVQVLTHQGGWPMSVFLTPELKPFYGGTYFPPTDQHGRPGFVTLIRALEDAYKNRRTDVEQSAGEISRVLEQLAEPQAAKSPITIDRNLIDRMLQRSLSDYDAQNGGFGSAPKFPRQTLLELLLVHLQNNPTPKHLAMLTHTLDALAEGGIRDQLGGGFHRYSTDAHWLVPHFEIMLYDNAMLGWCYVEAFRQTNHKRYAVVARGIFDFVLREMTSPQGAFYTAFDAEVDAQEGLTYLWTRAEVQSVLAASLGKDAASKKKIDRFCRVYGLDDVPNFADPHHSAGRAEKNILYIADSNAGGTIVDPELKPMREILYAERRQRKQPLLDTKIITSWNALMIRALAFGGKVLGEIRYVEAATKSAGFILGQHRDANGALRRTSRNGIVKHAAFLDDYAFFVQALLALHDADAGMRWKQHAQELSKIMIQKFGDPVHGAFYFTDITASDLIVRQKVASDSPLPSGVAVAAMVLMELNQPELVRRTFEAFAGQLSVNAESMSALLQAIIIYLRDHSTFTVKPSDSIQHPPTPRETAEDAVTINTAWVDSSTLNVQLRIEPGFHINPHEPPPGLVATQLSCDVPGVVAYPPGEYIGEVTLVLRFHEQVPRGSIVRLSLRYQPCNANACFAAVSKTFEVQAP